MMEQLVLQPVARATDPPTAHRAGRIARQGDHDKIAAIRKVLREQGPLTAFVIADEVDKLYPGRWDLGGIRSACARAGLEKLEWGEKSPRGIGCCTYALPSSEWPTRPVRVANEVL